MDLVIKGKGDGRLQGKIKVVQFVHGLSIGGAETLVKNYALLFDKNRIDILVICMKNHHSIYDQELKKAGIRVIYIYDTIDKKVPGPTILKKIVHRILAPFLLRYYMVKEKPNIIHFHLLLSRCLKFAAPRNVRLFYTVHSEPEKVWNQSVSRRKDLKAMKWLVRHRELRFIALHNEMKKKINCIFNVNNTVILNNGIDFSKFFNIEKKEVLRKKYNIKSDMVVLGHVGRFASVKNHTFLIDIFAEVLKRKENAVLWLIGIGETQEEIKDKVCKLGLKEKVVFWNIRNDIPQLLRMMDLFVMPSMYEGISVALIETQIIGLQSLVSGNISYESSISNLVHFYSLKYSAKDWAVKAIDLLNNETKVVYTNLENWDIRKNVKELEDLYFSELGIL